MKDTSRHQHFSHNNGAHTNGAHTNGAHNNGAHTNGAHTNGDSHMMVDGAPTNDGNFGARNEHSQMNGINADMSMSIDGGSAPTMLDGITNGSSTCHDSMPSKKSDGTVDNVMSNGAMEHREMVNHSMGYDSKLLESMYNYDAVPCGHAY